METEEIIKDVKEWLSVRVETTRFIVILVFLAGIIIGVWVS